MSGGRLHCEAVGHWKVRRGDVLRSAFAERVVASGDAQYRRSASSAFPAFSPQLLVRKVRRFNHTFAVLDKSQRARNSYLSLFLKPLVLSDSCNARKSWCRMKGMISVFAMNEADWMAGAALESCIAEYLQMTGLPRDEALDGPYQLDDEQLDRLVLRDEGGETRTFREQLQRQIDAGVTFPAFFASTEY